MSVENKLPDLCWLLVPAGGGGGDKGSVKSIYHNGDLASKSVVF